LRFLVVSALRTAWRWAAERLVPAPGEAWLVWTTVALMVLGAVAERLTTPPRDSIASLPAVDVGTFGRLDASVATAEELATLPGIGPRLAERIVEHRRLHGPFTSIEALDAVRGIGPVTLERLRPYLLEPSPATVP